MQDYRKEQIEIIRKTNSGVQRQQSPRPERVDGSRISPAKKPFVAKGHDAILKHAQDVGGNLRIVTLSDGVVHIGKMVARDKFTITIEVDQLGSLVRRTFYKHAIESFEPVAA